jgi:hypothetical protein
MDQTFNFRAAPVPLHRRLSPRAIALAVAACLVLSGLVSFAMVIDSEHRSMDQVESRGRADRRHDVGERRPAGSGSVADRPRSTPPPGRIPAPR